MAEIFPLAQVPLTCFSFNGDRSAVAVNINSEEAQVLTRSGLEWKTTNTLRAHDKLITSIDWAPRTNRIVTCAQDRNAYVWTEDVDPQTGAVQWKPKLVVLRVNRSATQVRWSPQEDKFAVATGARVICICYFDEEADWWAAKHTKKGIKSTILSVDWHPNNVLIAAGSADSKARVLSTYLKEIDIRPDPNVWGDKFPFGALFGEFASPSGGWVHAVGFSPSGDALAFACHDSTIGIIYPGQAQIVIKSSTLPNVTLTWISEDTLVAAGHDCQPVLYQGTVDGWSSAGSLDDTTGARTGYLSSQPTGTSSTPSRTGVGRLNNAAFNRFKDADSRGTQTPSTPMSPGFGGGGGPSFSGSGGNGGELLTVHQNTITSIRPYEYGSNGNVTKVATAGLDGKLVIWPVSAAAGLAPKLANIHIR